MNSSTSHRPDEGRHVLIPVPRTDSPRTKLARKLRILVVEDDLDSLALTQELLGLLGHWSAGVRSAEGALARFSEGAFDVLLLDVNLPALSGLDLAEKLCRMESLPVIFATGGPVPHDEPLRSIWLHKPYTTAQLEGALARAEALLRCADA
jgi:CheY-like chemotaxis protein